MYYIGQMNTQAGTIDPLVPTFGGLFGWTNHPEGGIFCQTLVISI